MQMTTDASKNALERDRYRELFYGRVVRDASTEMIVKLGGRLAFLGPLPEPQMAVRENADVFTVVVDSDTWSERPGVLIADLLTEMRSSDDLPGAFDANLHAHGKLSNNPFATENETQQALLLLRTPGLAARMRREAGVTQLSTVR
jgi:hypothetical protein